MIEVERLRVRPQFLFVRAGLSERRRSLVIQARMRTRAPFGLHAGEGYTATKKIGNAVIRNRARRRLKEAARILLPEHGVSGADYVFIARGETPGIAWNRLLDDMESALISLAAKLRAGSRPA